MDLVLLGICYKMHGVLAGASLCVVNGSIFSSNKTTGCRDNESSVCGEAI